MLQQLSAKGISLLRQEAVNLEATAALQAASLGSITPGEDSVFGRLCQFGDMAISCLSHQMANLVLKRRDTALNRISKFVGPESALTLSCWVLPLSSPEIR